MVSGFISKTGNGFLLFVEEGATIDGDYYLRILKKHLSLTRRLSSGWKFTAQQHVARCHTANLYINYLNENVQDYIKKEIWPPNLCDPIEKMVWENVKRYEHIEVLLAAISVTWDRLTKKFINNSIDQWRMFVCSYHVTYKFQSEFTLNSCLNVKEFLARSRCKVWSLSDSYWARTHNHLVHKRKLYHLAKLASLAKWLSIRLRTKWLWVRVQLHSLKSECDFKK